MFIMRSRRRRTRKKGQRKGESRKVKKMGGVGVTHSFSSSISMMLKYSVGYHGHAEGHPI